MLGPGAVVQPQAALQKARAGSDGALQTRVLLGTTPQGSEELAPTRSRPSRPGPPLYKEGGTEGWVTAGRAVLIQRPACPHPTRGSWSAPVSAVRPWGRVARHPVTATKADQEAPAFPTLPQLLLPAQQPKVAEQDCSAQAGKGQSLGVLTCLPGASVLALPSAARPGK